MVSQYTGKLLGIQSGKQKICKNLQKQLSEYLRSKLNKSYAKISNF